MLYRFCEERLFAHPEGYRQSSLLSYSIPIYYDLVLIVTSVFVGYFCMTHSPKLPITALVIPILWVLANNRLFAYIVVLAYHLTISRGLVPGAAVFLSETHTLADACVLWLLIGIGVSIPFIVFWSSNKYKKAPCLFLAFLFSYFLPPISLIGVVNPMIAAGCLFSGWGFFGLLAMLLIYSLCVMDRRLAWAFVVFIALTPVLGIGELKTLQKPTGFYAMNTSFGKLGSGSFSFFDDYERFQMVIRDVKKEKVWNLKEEYIILPETIAGRLNESGIRLWETELRKLLRTDQKVVFGGEIPTNNGKKYDNALIMLDRENTTIIAQRIPVPYSMYRGPWAETGANLYLWNDGILILPDRRKAAVIICYEAFLSLPYILSFIRNPDLILWTGNQWWCKDTSLPLIQERSVALWAQLFNTPALLVRNR